jgi:arsenate reductase
MVKAVVATKMAIQIYHNPRCSKSRLTKEILEEQGVEFEVIEYLKTPPTVEELGSILNKLGKEPLELMRTGEDEFKALIKDKNLSRDELIEAMVTNPKLIERPIVVNGDKAAVGRPPEAVLPVIA